MPCWSWSWSWSSASCPAGPGRSGPCPAGPAPCPGRSGPALAHPLALSMPWLLDLPFVHALALALPRALALPLVHALALVRPAALPADRVPGGLHAALLAALHAVLLLPMSCWPMFCCSFSASFSASVLALSKIPMIPPLPSLITSRMPVISPFRNCERRLFTRDCSIYPRRSVATDRLSLAIGTDMALPAAAPCARLTSYDVPSRPFRRINILCLSVVRLNVCNAAIGSVAANIRICPSMRSGAGGRAASSAVARRDLPREAPAAGGA